MSVVAASITPRDSDDDLLPDSWEQRLGLRVDSALGADGPDGDPDADGATNAEELAVGTHPRGFHTRSRRSCSKSRSKERGARSKEKSVEAGIGNRE